MDAKNVYILYWISDEIAVVRFNNLLPKKDVEPSELCNKHLRTWKAYDA